KGQDFVYLRKMREVPEEGLHEWYIYTSSSAFQKRFNRLFQQDITHGYALEMTENTNSRFLYDYAGDGKATPFSLIESSAKLEGGRDIGVVFVEGDVTLPPREKFMLQGSPLTVKISSRGDTSRASD